MSAVLSSAGCGDPERQPSTATTASTGAGQAAPAAGAVERDTRNGGADGPEEPPAQEAVTLASAPCGPEYLRLDQFLTQDDRSPDDALPLIAELLTQVRTEWLPRGDLYAVDAQQLARRAAAYPRGSAERAAATVKLRETLINVDGRAPHYACELLYGLMGHALR